MTALYRTRITHLRRAPVHHYFEQRGYSWYVDLDALPVLPRGLRALARFEAADHFTAPPPQGPDGLRERVDAFLAGEGITPPGGPVTALLQARVLGYTFNPLSLFWCHDADGEVRHVIAEVHNTYGGRHAYLLPPTDGRATAVRKKLYVSPFNPVDGYYLVRAREPGEHLDVSVSLHREDAPAFVATLQGARREVTLANVLKLQVLAPVAPLTGAMWIRVHGIILWLRRVPVVPRERSTARERVRQE